MKTSLPQMTYGIAKRRHQWLNLARRSAASLRIMVTTLRQRRLLILGE
jgi:hypothetical protein